MSAKFKFQFFGSRNNGFGLIGVLAALFIFSMGIVSLLALSATALKSARIAKMRLIASGLAQEGIEMTRYMRESNADWRDWYDSVASGDYRTHYASAGLLPFAEAPLKINPADGRYQYDSGEDSLFYRKINIEKVSNVEVKALVEVKWLYKGQNHYLKAEDRLWNWQ